MRTLALLAPVWLFFVFTFMACRIAGQKGRIRNHWVLAWMLGTLATGAYFMLAGEALSAVRWLSWQGVALAWILGDFILATYLVRSGVLTRDLPRRWRKQVGAWWTQFRQRSILAKLLTATTCVMLLGLGVFALSLPTVVWDSQTYHMPRVMHWIQQHSFEHYATNIQRQIESSPGAEIEITQLLLLAGNEKAANLPQWWALLTCVIVNTWLASEFLGTACCRKGGITRKEQELCVAMTGLITVTIPEAGVQAFTTQNDLVAGVWCLLAVAFGWLIVREPRNWFYMLGAAGAIALGISTKPTVFLYLGCFGLAFVGYMAFRRLFVPLARFGVVAAVLAVVINAPWMLRNYNSFGNPLGSQQMYTMQRPTKISVAKVAANVLRNASLYARTPSIASTRLLNSGLQGLFCLIGEDPCDPDYVFMGIPMWRQKVASIDKGHGFGNFGTALLCVFALAAFFLKFKPQSPMLVHAILVIAGFVLFCSYLKWQPWHERLHLTYFIMAAPFVGSVLGSLVHWLPLAGISAFLSVNAALMACVSPQAPVMYALKGMANDEQLLFSEKFNLYAPMREMANDIVRSGCSNVLLKTSEDSWEYPLWVLLKNRGFRGRIDHVFVSNDTARFPQPVPGQNSLLVTLDWNLAPSEVASVYKLSTLYGIGSIYAPMERADMRLRIIDNEGKTALSLPEPGSMVLSGVPVNLDGSLRSTSALRLTYGGNSALIPVTTNGFSVEFPVDAGSIQLALSDPAAARNASFYIENFKSIVRMKRQE